MRVTGLLYVGLEVPSLDVGEQFYRQFGLDPVERADLVAFRCAGRDQDQVVLSEGAEKRLAYIAFGVPRAEIDMQRITFVSQKPRFRSVGNQHERARWNAYVCHDTSSA